MAVLVFLALFLAITGRSSATYCVCKDGLGDSALQKALDYACGAGADCAAILQNGACFQPNTVKDHCSYAVNSYYQKKGQGPGTCDFAGTATTSPTAPSATSSCVYQASPGAGTAPGTGTGTGTAPGTGTGTGTGTGITPSTSTPGTSGTNTTPSTTGSAPNIFGTGTGTSTGLGPAGSGGSMDNNPGAAHSLKGNGLFFFTSLALLFSAPFLLWG